jgi:hypothetical protein
MHLYTFPGIFLGPTGNRQGNHKVFNINTGMVKKPPSEIDSKVIFMGHEIVKLL